MKLLGFYLGLHDSNLSFYDGRVHYSKSERTSQVKHHRAGIQWVEDVCRQNDFAPDMIAFSDGNRNDLGICNTGELSKTVRSIGICGKSIPTVCIDHHYAHTLSAWPVCSLTSADYGISIDGRGDHNMRVSILRNPGSSQPELVFQSEDHAYCRLFNLVGQHMNLSGLELDFAGKVMGGNAYGTADPAFVAANNHSNLSAHPLDLLDKIPWRGLAPAMQEGFFRFESLDFRDWLASVHLLVGEFITGLFREHIPIDAKVIYTGGAAQNTVYNQNLSTVYDDLVIPPHCYDGGISLGCLEYLRLKFQMDEFPRDGFPFWQADEDGGIARKTTISKVAEQLRMGKIVGWFQGKGEIGPRALGHRSILFDATIDGGKEYINREVKKREFWRPFAPSVLESAMSEISDDHRASPYMLRAIPVRESYAPSIPSVVHLDGTSRLQTVNEHSPQLEMYCELLQRMGRLSGRPVLLNTSLNDSSGPIISSTAQAKRFFRHSKLDVLCIGDEIWHK